MRICLVCVTFIFAKESQNGYSQFLFFVERKNISLLRRLSLDSRDHFSCQTEQDKQTQQ